MTTRNDLAFTAATDKQREAFLLALFSGNSMTHHSYIAEKVRFAFAATSESMLRGALDSGNLVKYDLIYSALLNA